MNVAIMGVGLAKHVFQLHGVSRRGKVCWVSRAAHGAHRPAPAVPDRHRGLRGLLLLAAAILRARAPGEDGMHARSSTKCSRLRPHAEGCGTAPDELSEMTNLPDNFRRIRDEAFPAKLPH